MTTLSEEYEYILTEFDPANASELEIRAVNLLRMFKGDAGVAQDALGVCLKYYNWTGDDGSICGNAVIGALEATDPNRQLPGSPSE